MLRKLSLATFVAILSMSASAHEIVVVPSATSVMPGASIDFEIHSTHVFAAPEELEAAEGVTAALVVPGGETRSVAISEADLYLSGSVKADTAGPLWLVAHRLGQVWSQTPDGWKRGGRDVNADARTAAKYEKFSKSLLNAGGPGFSEPVGHLLEIMPMSDPAEIRPGGALVVQVLHDGKPVQAEVTATFAGFSERAGTWAYATETYEGENGPEAEIRTWAPGLWFVRTEYVAPAGEGYDRHVIRAITSFEVDG